VESCARQTAKRTTNGKRIKENARSNYDCIYRFLYLMMGFHDHAIYFTQIDLCMPICAKKLMHINVILKLAQIKKCGLSKICSIRKFAWNWYDCM